MSRCAELRDRLSVTVSMCVVASIFVQCMRVLLAFLIEFISSYEYALERCRLCITYNMTFTYTCTIM